MYSLTISFGPTGTAWAYLFKDKTRADAALELALANNEHGDAVAMTDDFGQTSVISGEIHGFCFEDLEQVEAARIYRSLAEERLKVKLMEAARADPTIRAAMNQQGRPPVLTPMGGGFR